MDTRYPRIDELVEGKKFDHCFRILTHADQIDGAPAEYICDNLQKWTQGQCNLAKSYLAPEKSMFVDIETRGLAKRNQTWLIGSAHINAKGLVVEQFLARDPFEEASIIHAFFNLTKEKQYWISFNGITFDESRLIARAQAYLHQASPCEKHIDMFEVYSRDARKRGLKSVTLRELERVIFPEFKRENHIAGRDIPAAYQRYINGGDAVPVMNAIRHNTYDLVTLAAIYLKKIQEGI